MFCVNVSTCEIYMFFLYIPPGSRSTAPAAALLSSPWTATPTWMPQKVSNLGASERIYAFTVWAITGGDNWRNLIDVVEGGSSFGFTALTFSVYVSFAMLGHQQIFGVSIVDYPKLCTWSMLGTRACTLNPQMPVVVVMDGRSMASCAFRLTNECIARFNRQEHLSGTRRPLGEDAVKSTISR